ncbi:hypothetical protein NFI96_009995 [Prochilodus magdalenae]|nr:hypothetical protein NFI96_009995 [Prochilodus magdalenae]
MAQTGLLIVLVLARSGLLIVLVLARTGLLIVLVLAQIGLLIVLVLAQTGLLIVLVLARTGLLIVLVLARTGLLNLITNTSCCTALTGVDSSYLYSQEEHPAGKIRLSIFLIAGLCVGLPALVWALRVLYGHYKSGGRISTFIIMLLLSDLLELLLSPYVVTVLLQDDYCWETSVNFQTSCYKTTTHKIRKMFFFTELRYGYPFYNTQQEHPAGKIRLSIFLITGLCWGLPALVWALRVLYGHYKSGGRISALVVILLLSDLLELLLSPYVVTKLLQEDYCWDSSWTCHVLSSVWYNSEISFHRFPVDPEVRARWLTQIRRDNFSPLQSIRVCSRHFSTGDFDVTAVGKRRLNKGAVPCLFAWNDYSMPAPRVNVWQRRPRCPVLAACDTDQAMEVQIAPDHDYSVTPTSSAMADALANENEALKRKR